MLKPRDRSHLSFFITTCFIDRAEAYALTGGLFFSLNVKMIPISEMVVV